MKTKGDEKDINRMNDMVFRVWTKDLMKDAIKIREKHQIPKNGFPKGDVQKNQGKRIEWETSRDSQQVKKLFDDIKILINKHKLPPNSLLLLKEYICSGPLEDPINGIENFKLTDVDFYPFTKKLNTLKEWEKSKIPYIPIIIPSYSTLKETQKELVKLWPAFENFWRLQGWKGKEKRQRPIKNKIIKNRILELGNEIQKQKGQFLEIEIRNILKKEFPDKAIPSSENIKMILHRYKNKK